MPAEANDRAVAGALDVGPELMRQLLRVRELRERVAARVEQQRMRALMRARDQLERANSDVQVARSLHESAVTAADEVFARGPVSGYTLRLNEDFVESTSRALQRVDQVCARAFEECEQRDGAHREAGIALARASARHQQLQRKWRLMHVWRLMQEELLQSAESNERAAFKSQWTRRHRLLKFFRNT